MGLPAHPCTITDFDVPYRVAASGAGATDFSTIARNSGPAWSLLGAAIRTIRRVVWIESAPDADHAGER